MLDAYADPDQTIREAAAAILPRADANRRFVEDSSGSVDLAQHGFQQRFRYPVMVREPGCGSEVVRQGGGVAAIEGHDVEQLAVAEHVITEVFPPARLELEMRGLVYPPRLLVGAGWRVLARAPVRGAGRGPLTPSTTVRASACIRWRYCLSTVAMEWPARSWR